MLHKRNSSQFLNYISVRCFTICVPSRKLLSIFLQNSLVSFPYLIFFAERCNVGHCSSYKSCVANRVNLSKFCCSCCPLDASYLHDREKTCRPFCLENCVMFCISVSKNVLLPFKLKQGWQIFKFQMKRRGQSMCNDVMCSKGQRCPSCQ